MKINVGAGANPLKGYINIDRKTGGEAFPLTHEGVVLDSCIADEIRASHVLEHFSHRQTLDVLREWVRVLKPGGVLKIAVPDFDYAVSQMGKHEHAPYWIMGGHVDEDDKHGNIFTREYLSEQMIDAGVCHIKPWASEVQDCASLPVSLNFSGEKSAKWQDVPKPAFTRRRKILGIMSCPRTGFLHTHGCIETIFARFGIGVHMFFGAFWEQGIQGLLTQAIKDGYDDVITLDYDSVFDSKQFERMYGHWHNSPDVDALSCLQPQRMSGRAMLTMMNGAERTEIKIEDRGIQVRSAHFGLTFIRLDKLKSIKKPWFWNQPDENGEWKTGKSLDADMYFWKKWETAGNNLYVLPDVLLGHLEVVVSQIDPMTGKAIHRYAGDWTQDPYAGLLAEVKESPKPKMTKEEEELRYDPGAVYDKTQTFPDDKYPTSFLQRGNQCLGEPSKDLSGSEFQNVSEETYRIDKGNGE